MKIEKGDTYLMEKNKELACVQETVFRLYKNVKYLRLKNGLTIEQMADIMKISIGRLKAVEDCKKTRLLCDYHIKHVCDYFHVNANELFRKDLKKE
jgi:hypothetical protein